MPHDKAGHHMPQGDQQLSIHDPLAESFYYNSVYAFSENKVVAHVELEGLEAVDFRQKATDYIKGSVKGVSTQELDLALSSPSIIMNNRHLIKNVNSSFIFGFLPFLFEKRNLFYQ